MSGPLTLTDRVIEEAAAIVGAGNFRYVAFQRLGIPVATFQAWIRKGLKDRRDGSDSKQADLVRALDMAEGECHAQLLQDVLSADDPRLKMDFLRARYNKLYSNNPNAHLDDETGEMIKREAAEILAEKLSRFLDGN